MYNRRSTSDEYLYDQLAKEIVETERYFSSDLEIFRTVFILPLNEQQLLPPTNILSRLLVYCELIGTLSQQFYEKLAEKPAHEANLGQIFLDNVCCLSSSQCLSVALNFVQQDSLFQSLS